MTKEMTSGSPAKLITMFSIPLLLGNLFQQFYSMVDTAIVGRYVGVKALAAVGATTSLSFLIIDFVLGLTAGFAVPIAQTFGAGDKDKMRHYTAMSIYLCIAITVVFTLVTVFLARPFLKIMGTPADIIDDAHTYIVIIFAGMAATILYNMVAGVLRSLGDSKTPLYFLIVASILNIFLDLVFILKFKAGVAGAAYATVISQAVSGILCFIYTVKRYKILHLTAEDFKFKWASIGRLMYIGFPMALQYSITAVGVMVLQAAVNSLGSITVAAFTAASKVEQLAMQSLKTLGMTMVTYTGQNLGAGAYERIKKGVNSCMLIGTLCAVAGSLILIFFGEQLLGLFVSESAESREVILQGTIYLKTVATYFIPLGAIFIYRNSLQGMGEAVITIFAGVVELLARSIVVIFFTASLGYTAICYASPVAWIAAAVFLVIIYYYKLDKLLKSEKKKTV